MRRIIKALRRLLLICLCLAVLGTGMVIGVSEWVKASVSSRILTQEEAAGLTDVDCILVLGCYVSKSGVPSAMLHDRLTVGCKLYHLGAAPKMLMSGDHGRTDYNEVSAMKQFAIAEGIPSSDVFMDHAGFSTYESMYRARDVFEADKILIVTQGYHLYRALYVADQLGIDAYGVPSDLRAYGRPWYHHTRETLARCKDVAFTLLQPEPTYLGEAIPVSGNGDLTND